MEEKQTSNDLMIREVRNYIDKKKRRVVAYINPDDPEDITYMGHGFVPVPGIKQVMPFEFEIKGVSNIKQAYDKYDEVFKPSAENAKKQIREQLFAEKSKNLVNNLVNSNNIAGNR